MKNDVFWDIKTQFVPHRKHTSPLQSPAGKCYVRLDAYSVVNKKNAVFWEIKIQFLPHRKHYVSATEPSRLLLCET
jgi:hypothetical protein